MTSEQDLTRATALRRIKKHAFSEVLEPLGFEPLGTTTWCRGAGELSHGINLEANWGSRQVKWGVLCPETVPMVWGDYEKQAAKDPVSYAVLGDLTKWQGYDAVMPWFDLPDRVSPQQLETIIDGLRADISWYATWMEQFDTRRALLDYLLQNREPEDPRGFLMPSSLPMKLRVAAALAVLDRDPTAGTLVEEAAVASEPWGPDVRIDQLRSNARAANLIQ